MDISCVVEALASKSRSAMDVVRSVPEDMRDVALDMAYWYLVSEAVKLRNVGRKGAEMAVGILLKIGGCYGSE